MAVTQTLFMQEPGDTAAISINDVNQGWLGDCFVCAPIAALALERPDYIMSMIHDNGNGTQSVRLYLTVGGAPTWITVNDANLGQGMNTNNGGQLIVNGVQEIWPQVIENAIAQVDGGYSALGGGGFSNTIMQQLTGSPAAETFVAAFFGPMSSQPTTAQLRSDLAAKDMVTFFTGDPNNYSLVASHYYTLISVNTVNGVDYAIFRNPWGYGDPSPIPVSELGNAFLGMDVGRVPGVSVPLTPLLTTITGVANSGVRLTGTSEAGSTITITDNTGGQANVLGSATASSTGAWSLTSASGLQHNYLSTIHEFSVSATDIAGNSGVMPGALFLTDTGHDVLTATLGITDVFAIMSNLGSDVINSFQPASAVGSAHDVINFSGRGLSSFSQVQALMSGSSSTVITMAGGKTVTLAGVAPSTLSAADFRYS